MPWNPTTPRVPLADRFWVKVEKTADCWLWCGAPGGEGYGCIRIAGHAVRAHRVAWELTNGPIPDGLWVLHRCDNRKCVNPAHLFLGTQSDNMRDMHNKGRGYRPGMGPQVPPDRRARGMGSGRHTQPESNARGERNGQAKLSAAQVIAIRLRWANGERNAARIGREHGVSGAMIHLIVRRKKWAHI